MYSPNPEITDNAKQYELAEEEENEESTSSDE